MHNRTHSLAIIVMLSAFGIFGCKAKPAPPAGFVDDLSMTTDPTLPFQKVWFKPGFDFASYSNIYVAPVNTSYMLKMTDWQKGERKKEIEADTTRLGVYAQEAIEKAFREDPNHRFTVVDDPSTNPKTLIFEFALVEVVPSKVTLNALGFAPFFVGTGLTIFRAVGSDVSSAAFEAKILDAGTNQVVVMLADREQQQTAPFSVRGLTWYSHAETIIRQWSTQFVQLAERKPGEKIKDSDPFTLQPW